jgi:secondary thiamine-phosphate synthase enzyme
VSCYQKTFTVQTRAHNEVLDITEEVKSAVAASAIERGLCGVFTPHATAAITVNENDDPNIGVDFVSALRKLMVTVVE